MRGDPDALSQTVGDQLSAALEAVGTLGGNTVLVALSGGIDSVCLLHMLRFGPNPPHLIAAHLDHAIRVESAADANWVRGLCRAWGVSCHERRLTVAPAHEDEARSARYAFLESVRHEQGADLIVTGHHADDQAETVLFRMTRGAGVRGLAGIPRVRGRIARPLLDLTRAELLGYAEQTGLAWREDLSNHGAGNTRARIRHQVLPLLESAIAPGATGALARLADHAREIDNQLDDLTRALWEAGGITLSRGRITIPDGLLEADSSVGALLIREAAGRLGVELDQKGTARLTRGLSALGMGGRLDVARGVSLHRIRGGWRMQAESSPDTTVGLTVDSEMPDGEGIVQLGRRRLNVGWAGSVPLPGRRWLRQAHLAPDSVTFPLTVRGWRSGDRIQLPHGSKAVARLLSEAGVPRPDRPETPVVVGADGGVLWIPELDRQAAPHATAHQRIWMGIGDADE